jgi:hypothetical protein
MAIAPRTRIAISRIGVIAVSNNAQMSQSLGGPFRTSGTATISQTKRMNTIAKRETSTQVESFAGSTDRARSAKIQDATAKKIPSLSI